MPSKNILDGIDFHRDVPATPEDMEALWRARSLNAMDPDEYLRFLVAFTDGVAPPRETNRETDEPFDF